MPKFIAVSHAPHQVQELVKLSVSGATPRLGSTETVPCREIKDSERPRLESTALPKSKGDGIHMSALSRGRFDVTLTEEGLVFDGKQQPGPQRILVQRHTKTIQDPHPAVGVGPKSQFFERD